MIYHVKSLGDIYKHSKRKLLSIAEKMQSCKLISYMIVE